MILSIDDCMLVLLHNIQQSIGNTQSVSSETKSTHSLFCSILSDLKRRIVKKNPPKIECYE